MVRSRFLLASVVVAILLGSIGFPGSASAEVCTRAELADGSYPRAQAVVIGPSVDLTAETTTGSSGTGTSSHPRRERKASYTLLPPRVCANSDPAKPGINTKPRGPGC